jgi:hypothetical protein
MDKVQKYNSFNTNTPSSESYGNYLSLWLLMSYEVCGRKMLEVLQQHLMDLREAGREDVRWMEPAQDHTRVYPKVSGLSR